LYFADILVSIYL